MNTDFYDQLTAPLALLEEGLALALHTSDTPLADINRHILRSAGKRIRPALFFLALAPFGEAPHSHLPVALALELIHTASLLHDDVVDDAEKRRGRPSVNHHWGNGPAVLAGDYLFARAFGILTEYGDMRIIREMAQLVQAMSEGEILQQAERYQTDITAEQYMDRIGKKTARFFSACTRCAGLAAQAPQMQLEGLTRYGYHVGIAYQLMDDLLDFFGHEAVTGKPVAGDLGQGTVTLPVLHLLSLSPRRDEWCRRIIAADTDESFLIDINREMKNYGCDEYVRNLAATHTEQAQIALTALPPSQSRQTLADAANFILHRVQ
jgi:geranylgeranyl pyrophosphate synthase